MFAVSSVSKAWSRARSPIVGALIVATLSACDLPAGLGQATTRSLESGAATALSEADSFEMTGSYGDGSGRWTIDLQVQRGKGEHVVVSGSGVQLEAVVLGGAAYFRGQQFLSSHMGVDPVSRAFVKAAGNGWWKGSAGQIPQLLDLTDGNRLRSTFLGQAVTKRTDHASVEGLDAVDLAGPRAEVFIAAQAPHRVLRVRLKPGVVVDGIRDGDLRYGHYNRDFRIAAPASVIDFSDLSNLPPIYTVLSVDTSACGSPCNVSALVKNLGGMTGAKGQSIINFTMTDVASQKAVANCEAAVRPDVGFNATTRVTCSFGDLGGQPGNALSVTAVADNSGRSPSAVADLTRAAAGLSCRLPVVTSSQAGWLSFPDGSYQADSRANVQLPGYSSAPLYWKSYDKAFEHWLPVPRDWISPDGRHYAYADPPAAPGLPKLGGVHVVDVGTGVDHLFRPAAEDWTVLDYEAEGVYLSVQPSAPASPYGLWLLDPSGQHPFRQIDNARSWQYISAGGAWGMGDPLTGQGPGPGSRLLRLDLKTGAISSWYKRTDLEFEVVGADAAGHPLLQTTKGYPNQLLRVTAQNSASALGPAPGSVLPSLGTYIHPLSDAHGLWLGDSGGSLSIFTPAAGVQLIARLGTGDLLPVGGCH